MLVYAIRHAESLTNIGQDTSLNSDLSELGHKQAEVVGRRFAGVHVDAIYASPFLRCLSTAQSLADSLDLPILLRPELCEYHHLAPGTQVETGLDEVSVIARQHPRVAPCPDHNGPFDWPPADEPFEGVIARTTSFAAFLRDRWRGPDDTVILISHGSPIARLIEAWLTGRPGPWFRFIIDNAAVTALRHYDGTSSLVCLNEITHLDGLPPPTAANYDNNGSIKPVPETGYW